MFIYYEDFRKKSEAAFKAKNKLMNTDYDRDYLNESNSIIFIYLNELINNLISSNYNDIKIQLFSDEYFNEIDNDKLKNIPFITISVIDFTIKFIEYIFMKKSSYTIKEITKILNNNLKMVKRIEISNSCKDQLDTKINSLMSDITFTVLNSNLYNYIDALIQLEKTMGDEL